MKNNLKLICIAIISLQLSIITLSVLAIAPGGKPRTNNDLKLWYTKPAIKWLEALPLGNGRIGAMVFGGVKQERIILNESTLYSGEPKTNEILPDINKHIDILSRLIRNGEYSDADDYSDKYLTGRAVPCYQPLGDIIFQFEGTNEFTNYRRELDLSQAIAKTQYQNGGISFTRDVFVSHPGDAIVVHMKADKKGALNFRMKMESQHPTTHSTASGNKEFIFTGQLPGFVLRRTREWVEEKNQQWKYPELWDKYGERKPDVSTIQYNQKGMYFEVRVHVLSCDGHVFVNASGINVEKAKEVVLAIAVASSFNGFDKSPTKEGVEPALRTRTVIAKVATKTYKQLLNDHLVDYKRLFDRVSFQLSSKDGQTNLPIDERKKNNAFFDDPSFEALMFQYGRYLLISSSREGGQPANLQGLWNVDRVAPWGSSYTTNINLQMNYWAAETTNLSECHEPLFQFLREVSITGGKVAREMYNRPGWVLHHNTSIWRDASPVDWRGPVSFWPMAGGWLCQHLWQHYVFTQDNKFLIQTAYPLMKGAAEFYDSWLVSDDNGHLITPVSNSPENQFIYIDEHGLKKSAGMTMGSTLDMAIIRELFQNTVEAGKLLNKDTVFCNKLEGRLSRLSPFQIGSKGQLLEYYKEFIESTPRHNFSPYYPLYPGNQFTLRGTPELTESVKTLILNRTGSNMGGGFPTAWLAALWARLGDGDRALSYINGLIKQTHVNLFNGADSVFQIDANLGYTAAVVEMILQSHAGEIELLPALPKAWSSGSIKGLHARGGFAVDIIWQNGKLSQATIKSNTNSKLVLRYGKKTTNLTIKKGNTLIINQDLKILL